ncbi:MAG: DUF3575 domain-containing protein [Bacteroidales bacterium]|nr:DUF3575 domain-containing protein [Bacteroidales bacterium]
MESKRIFTCLLLTLASLFTAGAQQWALSTNVADYANYGTLNMEGSVAAGQHWSITAVAKYNPFLFQKDGEPLSARQRVYGAGVRFWPWHVYSGWWAGAKLQYQEYNRGGIQGPATDEGDRYGVGLSGGYSYMLTPHWNLDFGVGFWSGYDRFVTYSCPVCGLTQQRGQRLFFLPNDILMSLVYVF